MVLIISDLHLGSPVCQTKKILEVLGKEKWSEIIVNGDLLDSHYIKRYKKRHWEVLGQLRKISKTIPVRLISGNHDKNSELLVNVLGLEYSDYYEINTADKKILIVHGDEFDGFIAKHPILTECAAMIYYFIQKFSFTKSISRHIKTSSKNWLKAAQKIADSALIHIKNTDYTDIICSHVHIAGYKENFGKRYWNSGTFCDSPSHYIVINTRKSTVEIKSL